MKPHCLATLLSINTTCRTLAGERYTIDWRTWQATAAAVLMLLRHEGQLLLIVKQRGFGIGKVTIPGGHIEPGESAMAAAIRETEEEVGLTPLEPRQAGQVNFAFVDGFGLSCAIFVAEKFTGELRNTDEALPFWHSELELPYHRMWSDDRLWLPLLLAGRSFCGNFIFDGDIMLWHQLEPALL